MRAALLLAIMLAPTVTLAGDDWPDSPNKRFFESLQRPDNHKRPYQDKHSKSCCGPGDVVKTKFRVVPADNSYPEDAWFAWLREEWVRIPDDKIVPDYAPDGNAYLFVMYVGSKNDISSPGFDEILCFVRPKGGL
jgi:hypothetical protein